MTDPTSAERDALGARMRAAVPAEPELDGLAARAASSARRTRQKRRAGVAAGAALVVAAVVAVPQVLGSHPAHQTSPPPPVQVPAHPCSGRPNHHDFTTGTAAWVTFCQGRGVAPYPAGVLTDGAPQLVDVWRRSVQQYDVVPSCGTGQPPPSDVRVGFSDGSVSQIFVVCIGLVTPGNLGISGPTIYADLVRALGRQNATGHRRYNPPGPPRTCPRSFGRLGSLNLDGASASGLTGSMLLDMTAVEGLVCAYDEGNRLVRSGTPPDPEALRIASGASIMNRPVGNWRQAPATSYVVTLRDRTDTWRTFTITGRKHALTFFRGNSPGTPVRIGYAGESLLLLVHDATR